MIRRACYLSPMRTTQKLAFAAGFLVLGAWGTCVGLRGHAPADAKLFVGRVWVDKLPKNDTDHMEIFLALADDPLGVFQRRSNYEGSFSIFKYELRGDDKAILMFPQDKTKHEVRYKATACNVKDFDYCLEIEGAPRGAKKYLSRKEWELDATSLPELEKKLSAWQAALPVESTTE